MKAIILCDKRTGSTFLQNCLDSHPELTAYDEMFMKRGGLKKRHGQFLYRHMKNKKGFTPKKYMDWLSEQGKNVIFRLIYEQCDHWKLEKIIKNEKIPIIHLYRANLFEKAMSKFTKGLFEPKKIKIKENLLISSIKKGEEKLKTFDNKFKGYKPLIKLEYKEMLGEVEGNKEKGFKKVGAFNMRSNQITYLNDETNKKLCKFLNIDYFRMFSNVTKKNTYNVFDYIKNEESIKNVLKKNGMEKYLEDIK